MAPAAAIQREGARWGRVNRLRGAWPTSRVFLNHPDCSSERQVTMSLRKLRSRQASPQSGLQAVVLELAGAASEKRLTFNWSARCRACQRSYCVCMRSHASAVLQPAFSRPKPSPPRRRCDVQQLGERLTRHAEPLGHLGYRQLERRKAGFPDGLARMSRIMHRHHSPRGSVVINWIDVARDLAVELEHHSPVARHRNGHWLLRSPFN